MLTVSCTVCRKDFKPRGRRKYCSNACKQRAYRKVGVQMEVRIMKDPTPDGGGECVIDAIHHCTGANVAGLRDWLNQISRAKGIRRVANSGYSVRAFKVVLEAMHFVEVRKLAGELMHADLFDENGVYFVWVPRHALAVYDKVCYDCYNSPRRYPYFRPHSENS